LPVSDLTAEQLVFFRLSGVQVMKTFCFLFLVVASHWLQDDLQTWTDSSGKFQVEASLISIDGDQVSLRKADGQIIVLDISRLSAESQKRLKKETVSDKDYKRKESQLVYAEDIESFYQQQLAGNTLTDSQRGFIENRLREIKPHVQNKSVLIEGQFISLDELKKRLLTSNSLVDQWESLIKASFAGRNNFNIQSNTFKEAGKIIREAQKIEPFIRADFQLGIFNVLVTRDFDAAEKHFSKCVERVRKYRPLFTQTLDQLNFSHALGNLALLKVRKNRGKEAADLWTEVLAIAGPTPEFNYNVNRVLQASGAGYINLPSSVIGTFAQWSASGNSDYADRSHGWLYLPYIPSHEYRPKANQPQPSKDNAAGFICCGSGTGFVIAPGLVLTNKHVVETEMGVAFDRFLLNWDPDIGKKPVYADLIARSDHHDLALLSFPDSGLAGIPIRIDPKTGEDIVVIGFPETELLGNSINITKGVISKIPAQDNPMIVTDALTNPGNSGGPIIDEFGNAVGVHTLSLTSLKKPVPMGESGQAAIDFVREHRPDFDPKPLTISRKPVEIVDEYKPMIFRIDVFFSETRLGEFMDEIAGNNKNSKSNDRSLFTTLADKACFRCSGSGTARCPNKVCIKGLVTKYVIRKDPVPNMPGRFLTTRVPIPENCPVCSGNGRVACPTCGGKGEE
jgi:hypothetical protein